MTNIIVSEEFTNAMRALEMDSIPAADKRAEEMNNDYVEITKMICAARAQDGTTTLTYEQAQDLLDTLAKFNANSKHAADEIKSITRVYNRAIAKTQNVVDKIINLFK